ncbi:hypothetical protein CKO35_10470 [Ectothiorhodospira shaposhnikovii]|uniref:hypothetical protein n=1 Tax=Ectothiorhodospira shaposhnikovii TaxID=1054 RepID=UPI0019084E5E|nr:hypothetical protein [Ectothiorhodospira shaposhnikovii]MBK1673725.1 hypothetical protein [Ectothiorhodospira shaposhnikovii]
MKTTSHLQRDWLTKILAGTLLGLGLALGCSGLMIHFTPGLALSIQAQLAMWMVPPVWLGTLSLCFLFQSGARAWLWLGVANLLVFGGLAVAGHP